MKRCVIIGGAKINRPEIIKGYIEEDDYVIACDSGIENARKLAVCPKLLIGDFDSHERPDTEVETIVLPREKDDTDTAYAIKEGMKRGFREFLLAGVLGQRLDHSLANLYLLLLLEENGCAGTMVDDYSEISLISGEPAYIEDDCAFFSLLAVCGTASGVTIENAAYPLSGAVIEPSYQYAVSNEVIKGKTARVSVDEGRLLLVKDRF